MRPKPRVANECSSPDHHLLRLIGTASPPRRSSGPTAPQQHHCAPPHSAVPGVSAGAAQAPAKDEHRKRRRARSSRSQPWERDTADESCLQPAGECRNSREAQANLGRSQRGLCRARADKLDTRCLRCGLPPSRDRPSRTPRWPGSTRVLLAMEAREHVWAGETVASLPLGASLPLEPRRSLRGDEKRSSGDRAGPRLHSRPCVPSRRWAVGHSDMVSTPPSRFRVRAHQPPGPAPDPVRAGRRDDPRRAPRSV